jgi:cell wall-associated NlpC family hydrolase
MKSKYGWMAVFMAVMSGCVPQPIYHAIKKDTESSRPINATDTSAMAQKAFVDSSRGSRGGVGLPLAVGVSKEQQDAMMQEIKSWMGTPYRFGKVEKGKGTDCSGFVGAVFKKVLNLDLPRESGAMYAAGEPVAEKDLKFGDLVFFQNTYKGAQGASHVGIYVGDKKMAHASTTVGVTLSDLSESYYTKHFLGCRRVVK